MALELSKAIYSRLTSYTTLTNLVGTKVGPMEASNSWSLPYITYLKISDTPTHAMLQDATIYNPMVQIDIWAESYSGVRNIAKQVELRLKDYGGTITVSSTSLSIQRIFYENETEMKEIDMETNEVTYRIMQTYRIWHD